MVLYARLITVTKNRGGTGRDIFNIFGGENMTTGRYNSEDMKSRRDGIAGAKFIDGTGRYNSTGKIFTTGRGGNVFSSGGTGR